MHASPFAVFIDLVAATALLIFLGNRILGSYHMRKNLLALSMTEDKDVIPRLIAEKTRVQQSLENSSLWAAKSNEHFNAASRCYHEAVGFLRLTVSEEARATACAFAKQALERLEKL